MSENDKNEEKPYTPPPRKTIPDEHGELWGHDLYPERRKLKTRSITNTLLMKEGKEDIERYHCEKLVYKCIKQSMCNLYLFSCMKLFYRFLIKNSKLI